MVAEGDVVPLDFLLNDIIIYAVGYLGVVMFGTWVDEYRAGEEPVYRHPSTEFAKFRLCFAVLVLRAVVEGVEVGERMASEGQDSTILRGLCSIQQ